MKEVAIIGGGVAGLTAALSLADRGIHCTIVEKEGRLGGLCKELGCKGVARCVRCDVCLAEDKVSQVRASPAVERIKGAEVVSVSGPPGDFLLSIRENGTGAERRVRAGAIIVASGAEAFDAALDKRLGLGQVRGVLTTLDLERQLRREGKVVITGGHQAPRSIAFVLCVGSRDQRFQAGYCSKACCKASFKLGQALKALDAACQITFLFMDWRLYDPKENVRLWSLGQEAVRLVRSRPAEIVPGEDGRPEVRFASEGDASIESRSYDMVVLAVGMMPTQDAQAIASRLGIVRDEFGFLSSPPGRPCLSSRPGIFLAGACRGPKDILESVKDGSLAASRAVSFLEGGP